MTIKQQINAQIETVKTRINPNIGKKGNAISTESFDFGFLHGLLWVQELMNESKIFLFNKDTEL